MKSRTPFLSFNDSELPIFRYEMDRCHEKWYRLLQARDHLIQVCDEIDQNLNKNRLVRRHWNEKTSEWMERFKKAPPQDRPL